MECLHKFDVTAVYESAGGGVIVSKLKCPICGSVFFSEMVKKHCFTEAVSVPGAEGVESIKLDEHKSFKKSIAGEAVLKKRIKLGKAVSFSGKTLQRKYTTKDDDIAVIRFFFSKWQKENRLSEDQIKAIDSTKGVFARNLTEGQKVQILSIFNDVRKEIMDPDDFKLVK